MTTVQHFRAVMAQRRQYRRNPAYRIEWEYLTAAARKLLWIVQGVPVVEWSERQ